MEKFERNGVKFTTFVRDDERYLCTGENVTGEIYFNFADDIFDHYTVVGTTSVVVGASTNSLDELYEKWLDKTQFDREVLGIKY